MTKRTKTISPNPDLRSRGHNLKKLFKINLAKSILGWRGFKFVQTKGQVLFQEGDNNEVEIANSKLQVRNLKIHWVNLYQTWPKVALVEGDCSFSEIRWCPLNQSYGIIIALLKYVYWWDCFPLIRWTMWPMGILFFSFPQADVKSFKVSDP